MQDIHSNHIRVHLLAISPFLLPPSQLLLLLLSAPSECKEAMQINCGGACSQNPLQPSLSFSLFLPLIIFTQPECKESTQIDYACVYSPQVTLEHATTRCNTLLHTATRTHDKRDTAKNRRKLTALVSALVWCMYHTAHFNALQRTATHANTQQHTATHCSARQRTATHCNAWQLTATHANALQRTAMHCNARRHTATHGNARQRTAPHCNALQHTATHGNARQRTTSHRNALQHTAAHGNARQRTAPRCIALHCTALQRTATQQMYLWYKTCATRMQYIYNRILQKYNPTRIQNTQYSRCICHKDIYITFTKTYTTNTTHQQRNA